MKNIRKKSKLSQVFAFILLTSFFQVSTSYAMDPPTASKKLYFQNYHGGIQNDPYFWLRDESVEEAPKNEEILSYFRAENDYTQNITQAWDIEALQRKIFEEMKSHRELDETTSYKLNGYRYSIRLESGKQRPIYFRTKDEKGSKEEEILDLNKVHPEARALSLKSFVVSPNSEVLAYSIDVDGSNKYKLFFKNLKTGELISDEVGFVGDNIVWANDNKTLFYVKCDSVFRPYAIFRHKLGSKQEDVEIFREEDENFYVLLSKTNSGQYILIQSFNETTSETSFMDADGSNQMPHLIAKREKGHLYSVEHHENSFVILTNHNAPTFKVIVTPVEKPSIEGGKEIIRSRKEITIEKMIGFQDFLALRVREDGMSQIRIFKYSTGNYERVPFEESFFEANLGDRQDFTADSKQDYFSDSVRIELRTLLEGPSVKIYDVKNGKLSVEKQTKIGGNYHPSEYEVSRHFVKTEDHQEVPLTLVYKKGIQRDGSNPVALLGYGSYGLSLDPSFLDKRSNLPFRTALLDRGIIFAMAHVRGGGELGREWYEEGSRENKTKAITDFITCAQYLIAQGYTRPDKLVIRGASAGGTLVTAAANRHPELFQAVVASVPFVDVVNTMMDSSIPGTSTNWEEWGNPQERDVYVSMKNYSPYDNIGAKFYPHMLLTASLLDSIVYYWEPAKFTAKLRAMKLDHNVVLLKTEMDAGHNGFSGYEDSLNNLAFEAAYIVKALENKRQFNNVNQ